MMRSSQPKRNVKIRTELCYSNRMQNEALEILCAQVCCSLVMVSCRACSRDLDRKSGRQTRHTLREDCLCARSGKSRPQSAIWYRRLVSPYRRFRRQSRPKTGTSAASTSSGTGPRVIFDCHFRKAATDYDRKNGIKWLSCTEK